MVKTISMNNQERITSRDNQRLKFARRVRDGREADYVFVEGRRLCEEAVKSNIKVESIFCTEEFLAADVYGRLYRDVVGQACLIPQSLMQSIADTANPQGIVILAKRPTQPELESFFSDPDLGAALPIWVFLHRINNPSNLGAIVRTAEAAGARGIIVSEGSADPFSAKSIRASMGSAFRLPIVNGAEINKTLEFTAENGIIAVAVDSAGSRIYTEVDWLNPRLLVFGSEAAGLPKETTEMIGESVRIEIEPAVESLNIAVACGIVLFEARRRIDLT